MALAPAVTVDHIMWVYVQHCCMQCVNMFLFNASLSMWLWTAASAACFFARNTHICVLLIASSLCIK